MARDERERVIRRLGGKMPLRAACACGGQMSLAVDSTGSTHAFRTCRRCKTLYGVLVRRQVVNDQIVYAVDLTSTQVFLSDGRKLGAEA